MDIKKIKELGKWLEDDLALMEIQQSVIERCDEDFVKQYGLVPYKFDAGVLHLATANEKNMKRKRIFETKLGSTVSLVFTKPSNVASALAKYYNVLDYVNAESRIDDIEEVEEAEVDITDEREQTALTAHTHDMLLKAMDAKATDIHILPNDKKMSVFFKINAELLDYSEYVHPNLLLKGSNNRSKVIAKIKAMCFPPLSTSTTMPQSGAIPFQAQGRRVDCRVSILPSIRGESVVIRLLDEKKEFKSLENIGYCAATMHDIQRVLARPGGFFLVTGPVNSGKSTSLYACLNLYDFAKKSVITIEDPVEQKNEHILQVQTRAAEDEKNELTFAKVLREVLRHDPNVILVGEIRDAETALIAVEASQTGHKVFSTLHNKNVISTIDRLMNMGVDRKLLLSELSCVISQRLIPTLCPECCEAYEAKLPDVTLLSESIRKQLLGKTLKKAGEGACPHCKNTGYAGLAVVEECLVVDNDIRDFLSSTYTLKELTRFLEERHFITMQERALALVLSGTTSIEKYLSTMPDEG